MEQSLGIEAATELEPQDFFSPAHAAQQLERCQHLCNPVPARGGARPLLFLQNKPMQVLTSTHASNQPHTIGQLQVSGAQRCSNELMCLGCGVRWGGRGLRGEADKWIGGLWGNDHSKRSGDGSGNRW